MIHALILFATVLNPAAAQDREKPRIDPAYLDYLEATTEMAEELDIDHQNDQAQLWDGQASILDPSSLNFLGTVFVGNYKGQPFASHQTKQELWHFMAVPDPTRSFLLEHQGGYAPGTETQVLGAYDPQWSVHPCYNMYATYTDMPDASMTAGFDYTDGIIRTHFELYQPDPNTQIYVKVGELLREWHESVPNADEVIIDHWAYQTDFEAPANMGEELLVQTTGSPYTTTTDFWNDIHTQQQQSPGLYFKYSQIVYDRDLGLYCQNSLSW